MVYIIFSIDDSTKFLSKIIEHLEENNLAINVIEIHPTDASYTLAKQKIFEIPKSSLILFLGHGQSNQLYGGENESFEKKSLISSKEMSIFEGQNLFLLACDSSQLLKSTYRSSGVIASIGFGGLPTEMKEIDNDKKLSVKGITVDTIEIYKDIITQVISDSLVYFCFLENKSFTDLKNHLCLLINKQINQAIIEHNNANLADLLYQMRNELIVY